MSLTNLANLTSYPALCDFKKCEKFMVVYIRVSGCLALLITVLRKGEHVQLSFAALVNF